MTTKRIRIQAALSGAGAQKTALIEGSAYLESGFLTGLIQSADNTMSRSEQALMTAFTFTGCPIAAHTEVSDINPWVWTGGAYIGRRVLTGDGFSARSELRSRLAEDGIIMDLMLEVDGEVPAIIGVARPFQERIEQQRPGILRGDFDIVFLTDQGELSCKAQTEYLLDTSRSVPTVYRNITILTADENGGLRQIEQIDLFDRQDYADDDLKGRIIVH